MICTEDVFGLFSGRRKSRRRSPGGRWPDTSCGGGRLFVATLKFSRRFFPGTIVIDRPIELISTAELYLLHEDLRVLRESRPDGFIFENVTRFLNPSNPYALGVSFLNLSAGGFSGSFRHSRARRCSVFTASRVPVQGGVRGVGADARGPARLQEPRSRVDPYLDIPPQGAVGPRRRLALGPCAARRLGPSMTI
jgi:hypothetical protein